MGFILGYYALEIVCATHFALIAFICFLCVIIAIHLGFSLLCLVILNLRFLAFEKLLELAVEKFTFGPICHVFAYNRCLASGNANP